MDLTVRCEWGAILKMRGKSGSMAPGVFDRGIPRRDSWRFVCILVSLVNFSGSLAATWSARAEYSSRLILMAQASRRGRGVCFWVCAALCCLTRAAYAQPKYANRLAAESALVADIFGESEEYVTHSRCRIPP